MSEVLERIRSTEFTAFNSLFDASEGRMGVTVTFLSLLELLKEGLIELAQGDPYSPIHIRAASRVRAVSELPDYSEFDQADPAVELDPDASGTH